MDVSVVVVCVLIQKQQITAHLNDEQHVHRQTLHNTATWRTDKTGLQTMWRAAFIVDARSSHSEEQTLGLGSSFKFSEIPHWRVFPTTSGASRVATIGARTVITLHSTVGRRTKHAKEYETTWCAAFNQCLKRKRGGGQAFWIANRKKNKRVFKTEYCFRYGWVACWLADSLKLLCLWVPFKNEALERLFFRGKLVVGCCVERSGSHQSVLIFPLLISSS